MKLVIAIFILLGSFSCCWPQPAYSVSGYPQPLTRNHQSSLFRHAAIRNRHLPLFRLLRGISEGIC